MRFPSVFMHFSAFWIFAIALGFNQIWLILAMGFSIHIQSERKQILRGHKIVTKKQNGKGAVRENICGASNEKEKESKIKLFGAVAKTSKVSDSYQYLALCYQLNRKKKQSYTTSFSNKDKLLTIFFLYYD